MVFGANLGVVGLGFSGCSVIPCLALRHGRPAFGLIPRPTPAQQPPPPGCHAPRFIPNPTPTWLAPHLLPRHGCPTPTLRSGPRLGPYSSAQM